MTTKLFVMLLLLVAPATPTWLTDFDVAARVAVRDHKLILLNFSGSDWCAPCVQMKKDVFGSESFSEFAEQRLVLVQADFPRAKKNKLSKEQTAHNEALAEKYNSEGKFPLTLLLDEKGNVIKQWDGYVYGSQPVFMVDLKKAAAKQ